MQEQELLLERIEAEAMGTADVDAELNVIHMHQSAEMCGKNTERDCDLGPVALDPNPVWPWTG